MIGVSQLGAVGIGARDLEAWESFATEVMGLEVSARGEDGSLFLRMDDRHHRIAVHPTGEDDVLYAAWDVADAEALDAITHRLREAGVAVREPGGVEAETRRVRRLVRFEDPSGMTSELHLEPSRAEGDFRSPRKIAGFQAGTLGLGHLNLVVRNLDESVAFYTKLLGMRVSDHIDFEIKPGTPASAAFLRCNPRHHTLALVALPIPRRLLHVLLEMRSIDDVGETLELCEERGLAVATGLGRHPNDRMLSFYVRTPSGFDVECGTGGRLVEEEAWTIQRYTRTSVWGHRRRLPRPGTEAIGPAGSDSGEP